MRQHNTRTARLLYRLKRMRHLRMLPIAIKNEQINLVVAAGILTQRQGNQLKDRYAMSWGIESIED